MYFMVSLLEQVQDLERRLYISDDMLSKTKAKLNDVLEIIKRNEGTCIQFQV